MTCERMETMLIAYLDGKTPAEAAREVEAHLAACAACRTRAEEFRRLWGVLETVPLVEPSPAFDARLRERIAAEPQRAWFGWLIPAPRFAFAVALLLVLSVWISLPPAPVEQPPTNARTEEEFKMIKDLQVLEDYDVLANFEALSELPPAHNTTKREM